MDSADYEAVAAEYAEIEKQLSSWAVQRRRRFARRLRRQLEAMEALVFDGSADRWDPYDPYDAVITVKQLVPRPDSRSIAPGVVIESCLRHAVRLGWKTELIGGESVLAVHAGKDGPGAWSVFKWLSGVHEFVDPPDPFTVPGPPGAPVRIEVRVWPDDARPVGPVGPPKEWREDVYHWQGPSCSGGPSTTVRITHVPSGRQATGLAHEKSGSVLAARANAWRLMRAMLLADAIGPDEPAYPFVRPSGDPVGRHPLWGASSFDAEAVTAEARRRARPPADDLTGRRTPPR